MSKDTQFIAEISIDDKELKDALKQLEIAGKKAAKNLEASFNSINSMKFERGIRSSTRQMRKLNQEANNFGRTLKTQVIPYMSALVSMMGAKEISHFADSWTRINNRLKSVSSSNKELIAQQKMLYNIAQRTRTSYEATASLFTKTKNAGNNLGLNFDTKDYAKFTEMMNKSSITSGTNGPSSGVKIDFAVSDFSQILEHNQASLGNFVSAVLAASTSIENAFNKTTISLHEAGATIGTTLTKLVGQVNNSGGFSNDFTQGIRQVITAIDALAPQDIQAITDAFQILNTVEATIGGGQAAQAFVDKATAIKDAAVAANQAAIADKEAAIQAEQAALKEKSFREEKLKSAQARAYATKAALDEAKGTNSAKQATKTHKKAIKKLNKAKQQSIGASERFATAQRKAAAASKAATIQARAASIAVKSLNGVMAFFGGPVGLAITAIGALAGVMSSHAQATISAEDVLLKYEDRIKSLRAEVDGLNSSLGQKGKSTNSLEKFANYDTLKLEEKALKSQLQKQFKGLDRNTKKSLEDNFGITYENINTQEYENLSKALNMVDTAAGDASIKLLEILKTAGVIKLIQDDMKKVHSEMTELEKIGRKFESQLDSLSPYDKDVVSLKKGTSFTEEKISKLTKIAESDPITGGDNSIYFREQQRKRAKTLLAANDTLINKKILEQEAQANALQQATGSDPAAKESNDAYLAEMKQKEIDLAFKSAEAKRVEAEEQRLLNQAAIDGANLSPEKATKMAEEIIEAQNIAAAKERMENLTNASYPLKGLIEDIQLLASSFNGTEEHMLLLANAADHLGEVGSDALANWWKNLEEADLALINTALNSDLLAGALSHVDSNIFETAMTGVGKAADDARAHIIYLMEMFRDAIQTSLDNMGPIDTLDSLEVANGYLKTIDNYNALIEKAKHSKHEDKPSPVGSSGGVRNNDRNVNTRARSTPEPLSALEQYRQKVQELDQQLAKGTITQMQYNQKIWELAQGLEGHVGEVMSAFNQIGDAFAENFADLIINGFENADESARNFGESLKNIGKQLIKMALMNVFQSTMGSLFGGSGLFGGALGGLFGFADGGKVQKFASGGFVSGGGTSRSDSIPAMLSNGEYVINAKATKQFAPLLNAINYGHMDHLVRKAKGGFMGVTSNVNAIQTAAKEGRLNQNSNISNNMSLSPTINITMQGSSGDQRKDAKMAQDIAGKVNKTVEVKVYEILRKESTPGGAFSKLRR